MRDLAIQDEYRSDRCDLIQEFYIPCLEKATVYKRSVGFFSSTSMAAAAKGLTALIRVGGKMQLIASPYLSAADADAIEQGMRQKEEVIVSAVQRELDKEFEEIVRDRLACLAWLLSQNILEIKLAVTKEICRQGIYHEKLGIFADCENNIAAFTGSANESSTALIDNFECIDVFCSWHLGVRERALKKAENFQKLWKNETQNVEVMDFPEAAKNSLLRLRPDRPPAIEPRLPYKPKFSASEDKTNYQVNSSKKSDLWGHQTQAVQTFLQHRCGILEMATGTGKTRAALNILQELTTAQAIESAIITTIGTDLLDQWVKQLYGVASNLNPQFRVLLHYGEYYQKDEYDLDPKNSILVVSRNALRNVLRSLNYPTRKRLLIVHDEVHGLGSPANIQDLDGLSDGIAYRLGLSATPEREYDREGTEFIEKNVGAVIYQFTLEDAIRRGVLCEFDYYPIEYELSEEDRQRLKNVYSRKAGRKSEGKPMSNEEFWTALARVYKTSRTKVPYFEMFLCHHPEILDRCIVFVEDRQYGELVLPLIHRYRYDYHTYYAEDDTKNLEDFAVGKISCLVTCHRISQGIDIQSLRSVVLFASARSKLETVQRMGRCLRRDPNNPNKRAVVVDFVRVQDRDTEELNTDQLRKEWLTSLSKISSEES
ncbi:DEAD/DEAH box helicase family protein [Tychonema sp. LEGE 07203]|uniref:DEAD/DEAH box helicase family protein n=1 Tax=Tychonema sp. LEGE 07203 TaxID=1828671 RepID=UPI001881F49A|nr:DEAD/DEAH box helicase family protein [Tychonema sp. LEGE 07203]